MRRRVLLGGAAAGENRVAVQSNFYALVNQSRTAALPYQGSAAVRLALLEIGRSLDTSKHTGIADDETRAQFWALTGSEEKTQYYPAEAWSAHDSSKKLAEVFLYDGTLSAETVAATYASKVANVINIESSKATQGSGFTNTYAPYIEAALVTSPDRTAKVWVVTPLIVRTTS